MVAVAISVGFASQIVSLKVIDRWTRDGLDQALGIELARLTTALLVILLGWDWYDRDVEDKPLTRILRFILDAIIVMGELVLLLSSDKAGLWSTVLVMVFGFYVVWDILTIFDHPSAFGFSDPPILAERPDGHSFHLHRRNRGGPEKAWTSNQSWMLHLFFPGA